MGHPEINALTERIEKSRMGPDLKNPWDVATLRVPKFDNPALTAKFQSGSVEEYGVNGIGVETLIDLTIMRMEMFQDSEFACRENALVITKLQEARHWLDHRTTVREAQGVGPTEQHKS